MTPTNNQTNTEEQEKNILNKFSQILRSTGYLFPETDKEVENFESLYGSTQIEMPEHLKDPNKLLEKIHKIHQPVIEYSLVAFAPKKTIFPNKVKNTEENEK